MEFPWGKKSFIGDPYVYYWHRNLGNVSHVIHSALMALEKWLYDQIEKNQEIQPYLETIIESGTSLAFVGLLISIGKKKASHFSNTLLPLLSVPELYSWDMQHLMASERHQMIGWLNQGEWMIRLAHDFHSMSHRRIQLNEIAIRLFLSVEAWPVSISRYFEKLGRQDSQDLSSAQ